MILLPHLAAEKLQNFFGVFFQFQIGVDTEDCYVFEDSVNGVRAGIAAGCVTVMIPDLVPPPEGLGGFHVCSSLLEATALIKAGRL